MAKLLFLLFTVVPFLELYLLIGIGRQVGVFPTLGGVLVMGLLGAWLAKREGRHVLRDWRAATAQGRLPEEGILHGALVLVGGVLLITPGVITDGMGFLLLIPLTRRWIAGHVRRALERRMKAGTLRVSAVGWRRGVPQQGSPEGPTPRGAPPPRRIQGEEDAEFTEEKPGH